MMVVVVVAVATVAASLAVFIQSKIYKINYLWDRRLCALSKACSGRTGLESYKREAAKSLLLEQG
jgi:hypothetical protein